VVDGKGKRKVLKKIQKEKGEKSINTKNKTGLYDQRKKKMIFYWLRGGVMGKKKGRKRKGKRIEECS